MFLQLCGLRDQVVGLCRHGLKPQIFSIPSSLRESHHQIRRIFVDRRQTFDRVGIGSGKKKRCHKSFVRPVFYR